MVSHPARAHYSIYAGVAATDLWTARVRAPFVVVQDGEKRDDRLLEGARQSSLWRAAVCGLLKINVASMRALVVPIILLSARDGRCAERGAGNEVFSCTLEELGRLTQNNCPRASPGRTVPASCPSVARTLVPITRAVSLIHSGSCHTTPGCTPIEDQHVCEWIGTVATDLEFRAGSGHIAVGLGQQMTTPTGCVYKGSSRLKYNTVTSPTVCSSTDGCFCLGSCEPVDTACDDNVAFLAGGSQTCALIAAYPGSSRQAACDTFVDARTGTTASIECPVACGTGCAEATGLASAGANIRNFCCFYLSSTSTARAESYNFIVLTFRRLCTRLHRVVALM